MSIICNIISKCYMNHSLSLCSLSISLPTHTRTLSTKFQKNSKNKFKKKFNRDNRIENRHRLVEYPVQYIYRKSFGPNGVTTPCVIRHLHDSSRSTVLPLSLSDETQITKHFLKSVNVLHLTIQGGGEVLA